MSILFCYRYVRMISAFLYSAHYYRLFCVHIFSTKSVDSNRWPQRSQQPVTFYSSSATFLTCRMRTMYWGPTTDRPTDPPTSHFGKPRTAISRQRVIRTTSRFVLWYGFRGRRIEWTYFRLYQIQDSAARRLGKFRMTISLEWVIRFTFMNYREALEEYRRK